MMSESKVGADASDTYAKKAGQLKLGDHVVLGSNRPCVIKELRKVKNGKHGAAVVHMSTTDMFTGKTIESMAKSKHPVDCPTVVRSEYELVDIDESDRFMSLCDEEGSLRADLQLPEADERSLGFSADELKRLVDEGERTISVVVVAAMGMEGVMSVRSSADDR